MATIAEELSRMVIERYGYQAQEKKLFEEMSELVSALCHYDEGRDTLDHVAEEFADVLVVLKELMFYHGIIDAVSLWERKKWERLKIRLEQSETPLS